MHGDRSQGQRERALSDLKRGRVQVLVATDIASRGIDVNDISHVINYDVPHTPEDYVHRIGRTGRVEAVGDAFTLMSPEEKKDVAAIERFLGRSVPRVLMPDFDYQRASDPKEKRQGEHASARGEGDRGRPRARRGASGRRAPRSREDRSRPAPSASAPALAAAAAADSGESHGRRPRRNASDRRRRRL
ncbi:MAG: hypothetical protein E6K80_01585 [Candidatus Eisenbacteria bacterium]|uniref:Helicase C-terminal domain-containing protein n=1 Tax=Eiseniibacteriota bacterium TaxID=2212470 RepID=A0A538UAK2_UNCEI|nr:MAG: hypothetical protein E6K80_01585 [Candidatus Eisenbacteria bacterium]